MWPVFARPNGIISITLLVTAHYMGEIKSLDFSNTVYGSLSSLDTLRGEDLEFTTDPNFFELIFNV